MNSATCHPVYIEWLTRCTRHWSVAWAGHSEAVASWLEPALREPSTPRHWRHHATWEIVGEAVRQHQSLTRQLVAWDWASCQLKWHDWGGPSWDPYAMALAAQHHPAGEWALRFLDLLHHPIQPGLALWAYGAWQAGASAAPGDLANLTPLLALDRVLRSLPLAVSAPKTAWHHALHGWIDAAPPDPEDKVPEGRYPTALLSRWQDTLASRDPMAFAAPSKASQLEWF
jgi:hypothetical protein